MTTPITGPYTRSWTENFPPGTIFGNYQSGFLSRSWYRQKRPYDLPLTFSSSRTKGAYLYGANIGSPTARPVSSGFCWISTPTNSSSNAYNNAWSKFDEQIRGQAEWAVTLIQYRQTYDQLVKNVTDLYHVFRDVRKGNVSSLYRRFKPPKGFKMKGRSVSARILEWRFGWQPLWQDIHDSAKALGRDLGDFRVVAKGNGTYTETSTFTLSGQYAEVVEKRFSTVNQFCRLSADVRITNPNLLLWDSLGLANPALVAYELIPFSFVANYFFSLEEFCRGLVPFMGMQLNNSCTTSLAKASTTVKGTLTRMSYPYPKPGPYGVKFEGMILSRTPGPISGPVLRKRDPWILQPGRAINCVALLLQQLAKH